MEFRLLGDFEVVHEDALVPVRGAKQRALLAALALRRSVVVPADQLAEVIWGDAPPRNPVNALQAQISAVRKLLPEPVVSTRGNGYALEVDADQLDIGRFESMVADGRRLLDDGDAATAAQRLREALALWRGPALVDFAYDQFAQVEIARLEESRLAAVEVRIEADLEAGRHVDLVAELEALCAEHPLRERLWALRMVALYRSGRQADALRAYAKARERLVEELGIEPGPELRRVEAMVLAQNDELAAPERRPRPARSARGNLRARLTTFVGREIEVKDIADLLEHHRLVTLVGPGGAGKTRLAIEVADRLAGDLRDGAWLVELAPVVDAAGVTTAVASALGVGDAMTARDQPAPDPVERITAFLMDRNVLLVLDNCEHVIAEVAVVTEELLVSAPGLRVLATSREAIGVPGESLLPVTPLPVETAVELFGDRARKVDRTFTLDAATAPVVSEICRRLDGLPLAIELAAARLRSLPLGHVASRLDDRFRLLTGGARTALPRQQTLRAVADWSYDLLFEDEQRLLARLSVFPGGCRTDAAEKVCGDDTLPAADVIDLLARLVDKSLVVLDRDHDEEPRYHQLQTLWQYAREKLADSGEAPAIRDRHAHWYVTLAEEAVEGLRGPTGPRWRARLEAEADNLRAALDWMIECGDAERACALVTGMAWWWFLRADWPDAVRWFSDALGTSGPISETTRARAEAWQAYFAAVVDDSAAHVDAGLDALGVLHTHGSPLHVGEAALLHASTLNRAQRFDDALAVLREARVAIEQADHAWGLAMCDLLAANALARLGRIDDSEAAARSSVERFEAVGERWVQIEPMGTIAALHEVRGDLSAAADAYDRVIDTTRPLELPGYLAFWLVWRAGLAARLGDDCTAVVHFTEAADLSRNPANTAIALVGRARAAARLGEPPELVLEDLRHAEGLFATVGREDGRAAARVAEGLTHLDRGDRPATDRAADRAAASDPQLGLLLAAAIASATSDERATTLLERWAKRHLPAMPGSLAGLLLPDHDRLRAALVTR